jgi:hypothetical protein
VEFPIRSIYLKTLRCNKQLTSLSLFIILTGLFYNKSLWYDPLANDNRLEFELRSCLDLDLDENIIL